MALLMSSFSPQAKLSRAQRKEMHSRVALAAATPGMGRMPGVLLPTMLNVWAPCLRAQRSILLTKATEDARFQDIVFGKPSAPKEMYEGIARNARNAFVEQLKRGDASASGAPPGTAVLDVVMAGLHAAAEDDAIKSRTHIPLPVDSFSSRLDTVAAECARMMPQGLEPQEQIDFAVAHLFKTWGLKVAATMEAGLFSPYRVYLHNVLAQRCGTQAACAAVLHALLLRLYDRGAVSARAKVGLPADVSQPPVAAVSTSPTSTATSSSSSSSSGTHPEASSATAQADAPASPSTFETAPAASTPAEVAAGLVRWVDGVTLVAELDDQLRRAYWSWDWPVGEASGFEACARALLGEAGRAGKVNAAVGVMQASGRPFGNVELALLASERGCEATRLVDPDGWLHWGQVRDLAVQLLHVGRSQEGIRLMEAYSAWLAKGGEERQGAPAAFGSLAQEVLLREQRRLLEGVFQAGEGGAPGEVTSIHDPDRD